MHTRRIVVLLALAVLLAACTNSGNSNQHVASLRATAPPLDPQMEEFLRDYHLFFQDSMILSGTPGAAVVIVKDSQVVFVKGYGVRAEGNPTPVDEHTVFRIGSLSKGFTGILTGLLVHEGKLKWHETVQSYLPNFQLKDPEQAERLQIRHVLTQTTGLPYHSFSNLIERGFDLSYVMKQFPHARLAGKEGAYFSYQNAAFCLVEPIMQSVTGKTYQELLKEKIFEPLGMETASCNYDDIVNAPNHALPHRYRGGAWEPDSITHRYFNFAAAGGVNASAADMGEWLKALLGQRPDVLPPSVLKDVFSPYIGTGLERPTLQGFIDRDSAFYAKGWRILERGPDTYVYHAGFVNNFHCEIALNRQDGIGICVLFNAPSPLAGKCIAGFFRRWVKVRNHVLPTRMMQT